MDNDFEIGSRYRLAYYCEDKNDHKFIRFLSNLTFDIATGLMQFTIQGEDTMFCEWAHALMHPKTEYYYNAGDPQQQMECSKNTIGTFRLDNPVVEKSVFLYGEITQFLTVFNDNDTVTHKVKIQTNMSSIDIDAYCSLFVES